MTPRATTPTQLLLRRAMHPDEWAETYLVDLIRLNGVRKPWSYHVDQIRSTVPAPAGAARTADGIDRLTHQRARDGRPRYGAFELPSWASLHRTVATRYCPICMVRCRYIRTRWRLPLLPVCTAHGCYLKNDLAEPALTSQYKRSHFLYLADVSDEKLLDEAVCCLPDEFAVVSAVWGPLERAAEASPHPDTDEALGEMAGWTVLSWRLLECVARDHCRQVLQRTTSGMLADIARLMADARVSIAPNQQGVTAFLLGLTDNVHCLAAARCLRTLMLAETRIASVLCRLPLARLHDALMAAAPQMAVTTRAGERLFRDERSQALSRQQAVDYLEVSEVVIDDWIRKRWLPNVAVRKMGQKRFIFIDRADLKRARQYLLSLVYVEDFLREQGVDWPVYFALRKQAILEPVQVGDRRYLRRGDVAALACRLELLSTPAAEHHGLTYPLFAESAVTLAARQETFGAFVHAALDARFPVYRRLDLPGLSSFRVGPEALAWICARRTIDRSHTKARYNADQMDLLGEPS